MKLKSAIALLSLSMLILGGVNTLMANELSKKDKEKVIENVAQALESHYVLEDKAMQFANKLRQLNSEKIFNANGSKKEFAAALNEELYKITNDKHVSVKSGQGNPTSMAPTRKMVRINPNDKQSNQNKKRRAGMFPGKSLKTEVMAGNVGVLRVNNLMSSIEDMDDAMAKLIHTDSLIIDVRECPGGRGDVATRLVSYLSKEGTELMRYYTRGKPVLVTRSENLPENANHYLNKPVYIATSDRTGSACEQLAYQLKYHNIATVIGETTAGAGHALMKGDNGLIPVGYGMKAFIPNTKPMHPNNNEGFEKIGVPVDINTTATIAIDKAYQLILTSSIDENGTDKALLSGLLIESSIKVNKQLIQQAKNRVKYQELLGNYEKERALVFDFGVLKYQSPTGRKIPLKMLKDDQFTMLSPRAPFNVNIMRDEDGNVMAMKLSPKSGTGKVLTLKRI